SKKLALMPFDLANPVWVEDGDVDIDYHMRRITLPRPGSMVQLEAYIGRLHSSLLDRSRPLWEFYTFDGLESGQAAFYSKIHHAALDGQGGQALAQAILDITPEPRIPLPPKVRSDTPYQPSVKALLGAALRNSAVQYWKLLKFMPSAIKVVAGMVVPTKDEDGKRHIGMPKNVRFGPRTPLNGSITNQRAFGTVTIPLKEARELAKAYEGSLNDAVMAICSGALRRYLASRDALPEKSLIGALPVSLRQDGNTDLNNQVSMMLMNLSTDIADPKKRMRAIVKSSNAMKVTLNHVKSILPTDFPSLGVPWLMTGLVSLYGRSKLADKIPPIANVVISNVPGPRVPLYLAGAKMTTYFPVSIVAHGLALNITVQSYDGALDFGLIACRRAVRDIGVFAKMITESHAELMATVSNAATVTPLKERAVDAIAVSEIRLKPASKTLSAARTKKSIDKLTNKSTIKTASKKPGDNLAPKVIARSVRNSGSSVRAKAAEKQKTVLKSKLKSKTQAA
ncbi:MAG: wax ester/triacylglycerol synthase family O-acyltransferase, partial [Herminiimonas sp.]|nr:wax ester/triacylglycerol synthase family O-acyltransferase [Herminiimonas sp.]